MIFFQPPERKVRRKRIKRSPPSENDEGLCMGIFQTSLNMGFIVLVFIIASTKGMWDQYLLSCTVLYSGTVYLLYTRVPITVSVEMRRVIWFLSIYVKIGGYLVCIETQSTDICRTKSYKYIYASAKLKVQLDLFCRHLYVMLFSVTKFNDS